MLSEFIFPLDYCLCQLLSKIVLFVRYDFVRLLGSLDILLFIKIILSGIVDIKPMFRFIVG